MVEPRDPAARRAWQEIIEILFCPEDAALAARLPVAPTGARALARRFGIDEGVLRARLDAMADKGLVLDLVDARAGDTAYMLAPPVVGFFEFSMMRLSDGLPKARLAKAYEAYVEGDDSFLREVADTETVVGRTLVHETQAGDLLPEVLDWERASACVGAAGRVSVTNCYCRHSAEHLGTRCEAPMETCMSLDGAADYLTRHGLARPISPQEGLELLAAAREHGLVHIADNVRREITYVCSCCSCCCLELRSARRGLPVVQPSGYQPARDPDLCTGCGDCVRACPVQAISLVARAARPPNAGTPSKRLLSEIDLERCLGCGVCPAACRKDALAMERRPHPPYVPLNPVESLTRRMLERGRLADLLVDGTAGRGPAFANAVLGALLSLPPAERLLAREQIRSRFVAFALSRA
jgi:Pyruvate/2-oxoacid:ferredoxin oxidoreductase delta subunit